MRSSKTVSPWYVLLVLIFPLGLLWLFLHLLLRPKPAQQLFIIGHRGAAALAPENTLASVKEALRHRASHVEVDLQRTADEVLILMHDYSVKRTTDGHGRVKDLAWDQLKALHSFGEPVATLDQVLDFLVDKPVTLVVDVKAPGRFPGIERQLAAALDRHGMTDRTWVIAFDHYWLERLHQLAPAIRLGKTYIWMGPLGLAPPGRLVDVYWASVLADPTLVRRARAKGYRVVVWTVNNPWLMRLLFWLGVEGITTDRPDLGTPLVSLHHG